MLKLCPHARSMLSFSASAIQGVCKPKLYGVAAPERSSLTCGLVSAQIDERCMWQMQGQPVGLQAWRQRHHAGKRSPMESLGVTPNLDSAACVPQAVRHTERALSG